MIAEHPLVPFTFSIRVTAKLGRAGDRNFGMGGGLYLDEKPSQGFPMQDNHSKNEKSAKRMLRRPVVIAIAVAIFGVLAMLIVDHGPSTRPQIQTAEVASHMTTGEAASAVGATVTPTEPTPGVEPARPGPKPAEPASAAAR
jgi:hypothetical protein